MVVVVVYTYLLLFTFLKGHLFSFVYVVVCFFLECGAIVYLSVLIFVVRLVIVVVAVVVVVYFRLVCCCLLSTCCCCRSESCCCLHDVKLFRRTPKDDLKWKNL